MSTAAWINRARLIERFCTLVAVDNPSYRERAMADTVARMLTELGVSFAEDDAAAVLGADAGNLIATIPGTLDGPAVGFCAHLDSVAPACGKRAVVAPDGVIRSAGDTVLGADDLSAVAALLEAICVLKENKIAHRPIELIFTVCEEPYTKGSRALDLSRIAAQEIFVPDLTGAVGTAALAAPTILALKVRVSGRAAHAGFAPEQGIHAIAVAAHALTRCTLGHVDEDTTVGFGIIRGGTACNAVPAECELEGEIRGYDDSRVWEECKRLQEIFEQEAAAFGATVTFSVEERTRAYEVACESPIVARFSRACEKVGVPFCAVRTFGGSDANTFAAAGKDTLVIANAMSDIHSTKEYTTADEMLRLTALLLELMQS